MVRRTREKTKGLLVRSGEVRFRFSRSGGPGGQHVNKASTRVEALFAVAGSSLTDEQKARVLHIHAPRIDASGNLVVSVDTSRSQWANREEALRRCEALVRSAVAIRKKRVKTSMSAAGKERRRRAKSATAEKKVRRRRPDSDTG